ncbi:MAG: hypothetical protein FRX48_08892 [Lasallia pustulata]|uniref:Uncharacterized protein n=1 Tax=Lasallia pustulata TaxID=136370 RepID=A0A5M8PEJ4_9LECA|nr:MAG: hypothetical protein FRX48_08892 [Lasallia pustulata]
MSIASDLVIVPRHDIIYLVPSIQIPTSASHLAKLQHLPLRSHQSTPCLPSPSPPPLFSPAPPPPRLNTAAGPNMKGA